MKVMLRSCILFEHTDDSKKFLINFLKLQESGLDFDMTEDEVIWEFVTDFVRTYRHVPDVGTLQSHWTLHKQNALLERLKVLKTLPAKVEGAFDQYLTDKGTERQIRLAKLMLKEAQTIVESGMMIGEGKESTLLKGPVEAVRYVLDKSHAIVSPILGARLSGEVTKDGQDFEQEYDRVKLDPLAGVGQHSGLDQMDLALGGAKKFELWIHAAFTGGLKSTLALNWAYNQAVYYGHSSVIFSLEMPYQQVRRLLYAMHSMHTKFKGVRHRLGLQRDPEADVGLPYTYLRDGMLSSLGPDGKLLPSSFHVNAEKFLKEYVIPDFNGQVVLGLDQIDPATGKHWHVTPDGKPTPGYKPAKGEDFVGMTSYGRIHIEVADPDKSDFTMADLRQKAELLYSRDPGIRMIFVDHFGLMAPRKWVNSTTDRLNEVIRDAKRMAMSFNRGQGMAVVGLFQISREGYKAALKRKEKGNPAAYDLTHLSYANECVVEGTLIPTRGGFVPVDEIHLADSVLDATGYKIVRHVFDQGVRALWRTETDRGSDLLTTADHEVRVVQDGELAWRQVSELRPGDFVAGRLGGTPQEGACSLPPLEIGPYEKAEGQQGIPLCTPGFVTEDLAYLLGAWGGDGKVHPRGLSWTGNRDEVAVKNRLRGAFQATFGHSLPEQESPSRPGSFDLLKWPQPLKRWFEQVAGRRAGEVPNAILRSPGRHAIYLRGLFDTDGWVNKAGVVGIKMKAACTPFLRQVQLMLGGLGIDTHLSFGSGMLKVTGKTYRSVTLRVRSRQGRERFATLIGFTEASKQRVLAAFVEVGQESAKRGDVQMYPVPETFLRAYSQVHPAGSSRQGHAPGFLDAPRKARLTGLVSKGTIEKLLAHARKMGVWGDAFEYLRLLVEDLLVMRVVSAAPTGTEARVWDLEVGGDFEYQTGPLLSHNCERSADVVTATWVDEDLMKANRVQFQCLKSRDQKPFERFFARVEWPCRRIVTCADSNLTPVDQVKVGEKIDQLIAEL